MPARPRRHRCIIGRSALWHAPVSVPSDVARIVKAALLALLLIALHWHHTLGAPGEGPDILQLRVQVLPEFDDPRILVILQGRLDVQPEDLPLALTFAVPRGAQINQMAAMNTETGTIESRDFDAIPDADDDRWTLVTYTVDSAHIFYEYYYTAFAAGEPDRAFTFTLPATYDINSLQVEIQQPLKAEGFSLEPEPVIARSDETLGFTYHLFDFGAVKATEEVAVAIAYRKTDPAPSVTKEDLMVAGDAGEMPVQSGAAVAQGGGDPVLWGALGVVGLAGAAAFGWHRKSRRVTTIGEIAPVRSSTYSATKGQRDASSSGSGEASMTYCPACGAKLRVRARFCHVCGVRLAESGEGLASPS